MYKVVSLGSPVNFIQAALLLCVSVKAGNIQNDILVPAYSARYPGFTELETFVGTLGRTHSRAVCGQTQGASIWPSDVAPIVLQNIVSAESQQH